MFGKRNVMACVAAALLAVAVGAAWSNARKLTADDPFDDIVPKPAPGRPGSAREAPVDDPVDWAFMEHLLARLESDDETRKGEAYAFLDRLHEEGSKRLVEVVAKQPRPPAIGTLKVEGREITMRSPIPESTAAAIRLLGKYGAREAHWLLVRRIDFHGRVRGYGSMQSVLDSLPAAKILFYSDIDATRLILDYLNEPSADPFHLRLADSAVGEPEISDESYEHYATLLRLRYRRPVGIGDAFDVVKRAQERARVAGAMAAVARFQRLIDELQKLAPESVKP